jgi:hypothetical protein
MPPETCPNCGADVPRNARACPECGADEQTGWSEEAHAQRLGLPDENFDYDEFVKEEFGPRGKVRSRGISWFWWIVAVLVLLAFIYPLLRAFR